ncbi:cupin domain-containing protein [Nocardioides jensenii]|uniref:cupin domain-containing protein n=1 Tax=Nocardioides jensenii TaxID=1843 RepID=UPI00082A967F|nr:cupin domain-containing protein [Nocardioides jensenii]
MRILSLGQVPRRPIESHGSVGFSVGALGITADAHLVVVRLAAGGVIGRHPAGGRQILVVIEGDATVSGSDQVEQEIGPGQAAVWEAGELHGTRSRAGLVGFIVEGDVDLDTRPGAVDAP